MKTIFCCALITCLLALFPDAHVVAQPPVIEKVAESQLTFRIFDGEQGTFGYDIYSDGKKLIHQPTIPGVSGTRGFRSKEDAEKIAQLVIEKLKQKLMPPTVTRDELKRLKVID